MNRRSWLTTLAAAFGIGGVVAAEPKTVMLTGLTGKVGQAVFKGGVLTQIDSGIAPTPYEIVRRHIQNELEGQAKVSIMLGQQAPSRSNV